MLEEAITAERAALEEGTRERVSLAWAITEMNVRRGTSRAREA